MSSGTGTSINQSYNTLQGGLMSQPYPSMVHGNNSIYENGGSAISTNYAPNIKFLNGGKRRRTKKREQRKKKNNVKRQVKSKKTCSICKNNFGWV